ncbi:MAG: RluA family pseudouridine synthase [Alphaproteobacteria bacterium]
MGSDALEFSVQDEYIGLRADKFLSLVCEDLSRARLQSLISDGQVLRNGVVLKTASLKTELEDVFVVHVPPPEPSSIEPEDIPLDIVYEDEELLVVNKAVGMVVHPGAGNWSGTLVNALQHYCGDSLSGIGGELRPGIVHRLDKDTSGLMMVAKTDHAHQYLSAQLADRSLSRIYHALVLGVPLPIKGSVDRPIGRHRHNRLKMSVMSNSPKDARTHYKVIENYSDVFSLVECSLDTGRTHQIRVHMEAIGNPLVGDPLYGPQNTGLISNLKKAGHPSEVIKEFLELKRQMLHARAIRFIHPISEEEMFFECPMPEDIANTLKKLSK